jgi:transposase InsO family protein
LDYGLHASQSSAPVLGRSGRRWTTTAHRRRWTDNGSQYVSWGGKSAFSKQREKRGVHEVVSSPRHPRALGKIERF